MHAHSRSSDAIKPFHEIFAHLEKRKTLRWDLYDLTSFRIFAGTTVIGAHAEDAEVPDLDPSALSESIADALKEDVDQPFCGLAGQSFVLR